MFLCLLIKFVTRCVLSRLSVFLHVVSTVHDSVGKVIAIRILAYKLKFYVVLRELNELN